MNWFGCCQSDDSNRYSADYYLQEGGEKGEDDADDDKGAFYMHIIHRLTSMDEILPVEIKIQRTVEAIKSGFL